MSGLLVAILAAAVGAMLSAVIAYPLGRIQGRQQTLYEEQVKIISEIRRLVLKTDAALSSAISRPDQEEYVKALGESVRALSDSYGDKSIWLYPSQNAKIGALVKGYRDQLFHIHSVDFPRMDETSKVREVEEHRASQRAGTWSYSEGRRLVGELEEEAKRLLGTDQRPFWQRLFR